MKNEDLDSRYEVVGFSERLFSYNIDITILMFFFMICSLIIENNDVLYVVCLIFITLYFTIFESSEWQGTPGKRYNKLKVINDEGMKISVVRALLRVLLKYVSIMLLFLGIFMIYFRKDRKSLHDIILRTQVVKQ